MATKTNISLTTDAGESAADCRHTVVDNDELSSTAADVGSRCNLAADSVACCDTKTDCTARLELVNGGSVCIAPTDSASAFLDVISTFRPCRGANLFFVSIQGRNNDCRGGTEDFPVAIFQVSPSDFWPVLARGVSAPEISASSRRWTLNSTPTSETFPIILLMLTPASIFSFSKVGKAGTVAE